MESNTGSLIRTLRMELKLTQRELADKLYMSDKAVSKWERGIGLPDISVINELASIFNVSVEYLLNGEKSNVDKANGIKKTSFYACDHCGNVMFSANSIDVICCDKKLSRLEEKVEDEMHSLDVVKNDGSFLITIDHEMEKNHFIRFVAIKKGSGLNFIQTFPEWDLNIRDENLRFCRIYYYCTKHGLFYKQMK